MRGNIARGVAGFAEGEGVSGCQELVFGQLDLGISKSSRVLGGFGWPQAMRRRLTQTGGRRFGRMGVVQMWWG